MRLFQCLTCVVVLALMTGCSSVAGTWVADKSSGDANPIASVTFAGDGTYTATAQYGDTSRAVSGHYELEDGTIELDSEGTVRSYGIDVGRDEMTLTHEGRSYRMMRMKPRE